jgi:hypothetical protein
MPLLHLTIAHLLGDFVLQPNKLIEKKYHSWKGTLIHALIIGALTTLLLFPYLASAKTWLIILLITALHFLQDLAKVSFDKKINKNKSTLPFFVDQALHLTVLTVMASYLEVSNLIPLPAALSDLYYSETILIAIVSIIVLTYTLDITFFQFELKKLKLKNKKKTPSYHPDYKGMMVRVLAFTFFYLLLILGA